MYLWLKKMIKHFLTYYITFYYKLRSVVVVVVVLIVVLGIVVVVVDGLGGVVRDVVELKIVVVIVLGIVVVVGLGGVVRVVVVVTTGSQLIFTYPFNDILTRIGGFLFVVLIIIISIFEILFDWDIITFDKLSFDNVLLITSIRLFELS